MRRAAELDRLAAALTAPPAVAVVEGEAGVGKSRLIEELTRLPALAGRRSAAGWCRPIREPFPLAPFIDAIRGIGAEIPPERLSPVAGALRPLLPELAGILPPLPEPLDDRAAERHRVFRGLVEVLDALGPTVLVLEDLHWADDHTVDLLAYLLGDPPAALSLVVTLRTEDATAEVRALLSRAPARVGPTRILLTPLDAAGTASLAAAILDTAAVPAELSDLLHRRTSGLPFAVEELLALLRERGLLVREDGYRLRGSPAELDVPAGVRDPVLGRLARLSDDGRAVARAAAVLQAPVKVPLLAATSLVPASRLPQALEEALRSGLLVPHDRSVGFRHLLATHAVYGDMPEPLRRILHERAADTLATTDPVPLGQLAHHLRHAGRLAEWVDVAERAADRAVEVGHDQEATRLLEEVLRDAPLDPSRRGRIAAKLGRAAMATVPARRQVTDLLAQALEQELPRRLRGEVRYWLALLLGQTGADPRGARPLLARAVADLDGDPELTASATATMALRAIAEIPPEDPRPWLYRARAVVAGVAGTSSQVDLLGRIAATMLVIGDPDWASQVDRAQALTGGRPQGRREVHAYYLVGTAATLAGHHDLARGLLAQGLAGVAACGNLRLELLLRSTTAVAAYLRGAWQGLPQTLDRLAGEVGDFPPARIDVELAASGLALAGGDLPRAEALLSQAASRADRLADFLFLPFGATLAIRLALARGDTGSAMVHGDKLLAAVGDGEVWAPFARVLPVLAEATVAAGRAGAARALVRRWTHQLAQRDAPLSAAAVPHARGILAVGDRRWSAAARRFREAADRYAALQSPYESAQANEQAARCLFEAGDPAAAAPLVDAIATYQRLSATWDLDRARSLARQHGVPVPNRHRGGRRGYGNRLSPREREVAERAALGRTNKEIADELFLSPHTVDKHVRNALRKLGLRSRAALAHRLGAARTDPAKNGAFSP